MKNWLTRFFVITSLMLSFLSQAAENCDSDFKGPYSVNSSNGTFYVTRKGLYQDQDYDRLLRFVLCNSQNEIDSKFAIPRVMLPAPTFYMNRIEPGLEEVIGLTLNPGKFLIAWGITDFPESTYTCWEGHEPRVCIYPRVVYLSVQPLRFSTLENSTDRVIRWDFGASGLVSLSLPNGSKVKNVKILSGDISEGDTSTVKIEVTYIEGYIRTFRYQVSLSFWSSHLELMDEI